jgi:hypothetical protein
VSGGYDRFMIDIEIGGSPKVAQLTDREFRCLICGVWPLVAKASPRGYLVVRGNRGTAEDVARQARLRSLSVARVTLAKMRQLGMLEEHPDVGLEYCHDWDLLNPAPKVDRTSAERQARHRARQAARNAVSNGADNRAPNAGVTPGVTP